MTFCAPTLSKTCKLWYNHDSCYGVGPSFTSEQSILNQPEWSRPKPAMRYIPSAAKDKSRAMFDFNITLAKHPSCMLTTEKKH